jgi:hypothetical protein
MNKKKKKKQQPAPVTPTPTPTPNPLIVMPVPPPAPIPNPEDGTYQNLFDANYPKAWGPRLQPFFYGHPGGLMPDPISPDDAMALADELYKDGVEFDQEICLNGSPYENMYQRKVVYGYTRVPTGQGNDGPTIPINDADFFGPVVQGYLLVSVDINDFPPYVA